MIPLRKPRNGRMQLLASALCGKTIASQRIIESRTGGWVEVKLSGHTYGAPRVMMPRQTFADVWNRLKDFDEEPLGPTSEIRVHHGRRVCKFVQGRECVIRVQHLRMDGDRDLWSHEVVEVL